MLRLLLLLLVIPAKAGIQCLGFAGMTSKRQAPVAPDITQRERGAIKP
jgi:hypothetical protein